MTVARNKPSKRPSPGPETEPALSTWDKTMVMVGVVAALVIVVLVNVLSARHYRRWDMTSARLYTLSDATTQTLDSLERDVQVDVLLSSTDPLRQSIDDLLKIYRGRTSRLHVRYVDPDRHPAEFAAMQQRYGIIAGRTQDGRVVADTAVVVTSGKRHWFITPDDMVEISDTAEGLTKSKIEQALTIGIRSVLDSKRLKVCFAAGHGEYSPDDISNRGLSEIRDRLTKENNETSVEDLTKGDVENKLSSCDMLVVASPSVPYEEKLARAVAARVKHGLDLLLVVGPISDPNQRHLLPTGFERLAQSYGLRINADVVFERDPALIVPRGSGEVFLPEIKHHDITKALLGPAAAIASMRIVVRQSRSFDILDPSLALPLLDTSDKAFGMVDYYAWVRAGGEPKPSAASLKGPRTVAAAAQLGPEDDSLQSRLVALGTPALIWNENFRNPARQGNALFIDSALSWLTSKPPIVDVPAKVVPSTNLHLTEQSLAEILRYVLLFMPLAAMLLGVAVRMRRNSANRRIASSNEDRSKQAKD